MLRIIVIRKGEDGLKSVVDILEPLDTSKRWAFRRAMLYIKDGEATSFRVGNADAPLETYREVAP